MTGGKVLYIADIAVMFNKTECAIRSMVHKKDSQLPPYFRMGNRIAWREATIKAWLDKKDENRQSVKDMAESFNEDAVNMVYAAVNQYIENNNYNLMEWKKAIHDIVDNNSAVKIRNLIESAIKEYRPHG